MSEKRWVKAPINSGRWIPQSEGESLCGIYLEKEDATFRGRKNWKYFFQTKNQCANSDGIGFVYGTEAINEGMKDIPENKGYEVEIEFAGEVPSNDPKKKPFKRFIIKANITPEDPLYKKWYPEDTTETGEDETEKPAHEMNLKDDPEALTTIESYIEILESTYKEPTCEAIIKLAESDPDLKPEDLTRLKVQLIEMHKQGKIKSEKGGK